MIGRRQLALGATVAVAVFATITALSLAGVFEAHHKPAPAAVRLAPVPAPYPPAVEQNFLDGCNSTATSNAYCDCALSWIEANVPLTSFEAAEASFDPSNPPAWFYRAAAACTSS